jgi:two-component system sensor kinase FixL
MDAMRPEEGSSPGFFWAQQILILTIGETRKAMTIKPKIPLSSARNWQMRFGAGESDAELEWRLQESEERFRLLVAGVQDRAIFMLDPQGHVINWNAAAQHVTGWTESEILNRPFAVFFPDEALERGDLDSHLRIVAAAGKFVERARRRRKDGSIFWAEVEMKALHDARGEVRGFANVLRDVSDPVQANRDVADCRARRAKIVESAMDAIITVDAEQNILAFNDAAEKMFGYTRADIVGRKLDVVIPDRFRGDGSRSMGFSRALSARRADGAGFSAEAAIFQASLDGGKFFSIVLRDNTERDERQARLLREFGSRIR